MSWGTWQEDCRYLSKDGEHMIVVSKRTDHTGRTYWKNERKRLSPLSPSDRAYYESLAVRRTGRDRYLSRI